VADGLSMMQDPSSPPSIVEGYGGSSGDPGIWQER